MGAWIETFYLCFENHFAMSHPVWVRGLKLISKKRERIEDKSHPVWVRGLKHYGSLFIHRLISRTLYGCVD